MIKFAVQRGEVENTIYYTDGTIGIEVEPDEADAQVAYIKTVLLKYDVSENDYTLRYEP